VTLREKILVLENRIIDWLTILTWWIEVRFGKTNVDVAMSVSLNALFVFCLANVSITIVTFNNGQTGWCIFFSFFTVLMFIGLSYYLFLPEAARDYQLKKFPQGCPNPSRKLKEASNQRLGRALFMSYFLIHLFDDVTVTLVLLTIFFFMHMLVPFLLSCDSIPPEEKAKRRARNEIENLVTQSTGA
jgi:dipeptide/tripeptide permease